MQVHRGDQKWHRLKVVLALAQGGDSPRWWHRPELEELGRQGGWAGDSPGRKLGSYRRWRSRRRHPAHWQAGSGGRAVWGGGGGGRSSAGWRESVGVCVDRARACGVKSPFFRRPELADGSY
jgi:hypothetical protein